MRYLYTIGVVLTLLLSVNSLNAQVVLTAESGNQAIEQGNCWGFTGVAYTNASKTIINGKWSLRTNMLTSISPTYSSVKSPWMSLSSGNITMKYKTDGKAATSRSIELYYIKEDITKPNSEGTPVLFSSINLANPTSTTLQTLSIAVPAVMLNSTDKYKIRVSFEGNGGQGRIIADDLSIPGKSVSDPSRNCLPISTVTTDADKDGVLDVNDVYPNDPYRAYNNIYPATGNYGTLAFEDSWPNLADYDFNDLVVDYRINTVTNAKNQVVEVVASFTLRASGAGYKNGFGFQIDGLNPKAIVKTSGNVIKDAYILNDGNGLESNQQYATCIVFDNFKSVLNHPGSGTGINTDPTAPRVTAETIDVHLVFIENGVSPNGVYVNYVNMPSTLFNFFLIVDGNRGHEVHLADRMPTSLVDVSLFGTGKDKSDIAAKKYYKTDTNLPWAIDVIEGFNYPVEKVSIDKAYLHFLEWAQSAGLSYPDWFQSNDGYIVTENVYNAQ